MKYQSATFPLVLLAALAAVAALAFHWQPGPANAVTGPNFSIAIAGDACHPSTGGADCDIDPNTTFTLSISLDKTNLPSYRGFQVLIAVPNGITYVNQLPQDEVVWPDCDLAYYGASVPVGQILRGCTRMAANSPSTYLGDVIDVDYACSGSSVPIYTIRLLQGASGDAAYVVTNDYDFAPDPEGGPEKTLTIRCFAEGAPTIMPTPTRTNTPIPTSTAIAPTATRTATSTPTPFAKACGDVNDDGHVNSIDSALILQLEAGLLTSLANMPSADVNSNGHLNSVDAALILQYGAGLVSNISC